MPSKHNPSTNWVFTLNNPDIEDEQALLETVPYRYLIYQHEVAESGTHHIQGYFVLERRLRLTALKALLPYAHFEVRQGTHEQAKAYCSKADTRMVGTEPVEWGSEEGIATKRGQRSDLLLVKSKIDEGATKVQIWDEHFSSSVRYHKAFDEYRRVKMLPRVFAPNEQPKVYIFWGKSGTGKTRTATEMYPNAYVLSRPSHKGGQIWWQRYEGQETVIVDEFYGWIPYDLLLRYIDRLSYEVEYKGGSMPLRAKTWIFTSNKPWEQWYKNIDTHALKRRFDEWAEIREFAEKVNFAAPIEDGYISEEL